MAERERNTHRGRQGLSVSMVLGILLVPLSAFAASMLVRSDPPVEPSAPVPVTATTPQADVVTSSQTATVADLKGACGDAGLQLVTAEATGSISGVQQAALAALRDLCAEQGMALPGTPVADPILQTVMLSDSAPLPSIPHAPGGVVGGDDHDHDDDDDHDDDHDEDDDDHDDDDHEEEDDD